jgi:mannose-1-phosphate guanylyltransferase/phosphomannomutase
MQAIIICGGQGTRMTQAGFKTPKVLLNFGKKTLLELQIEQLENAGATEVLLLLGEGSQLIIDFISDRKLDVKYIVETKGLGTGGALLNALAYLQSRFYIVYGDILFSTNVLSLSDELLRHNRDLVLMTRTSDHIFDSDVVVTDNQNRVKQIIRKPGFENFRNRNNANCGIYVSSKKALEEVLNDFNFKEKIDFDSDVLNLLISKGSNISTVKSNGYVRDIGTKDRYESAIRDYELGRVNNESRPTVILDRDGVIIKDSGHISRTSEVSFIPESLASIKTLCEAGFRVVVITNQPVIARGMATPAIVENIHTLIDIELARINAYISGYYYCPHHPDSGFQGEIKELKIFCECRKPKIALYAKANADFPMNLSCSYAVGDSWRDYQAAKTFGVEFLGIQEDKWVDNEPPRHIFSNLAEACRFILSRKRSV